MIATTQALPCSDCGTTGGHVALGRTSPSRTSGEPFGLDGELCVRCYNRHYKRRGRMGKPAPKPLRSKRPPISDIDPVPYQWLVRLVAREFVGLGMDLDDLIGYGQVALLKACKSFDSTRGAKFSTFAGTTIRFALRSELAAKVPFIYVPRSLDLLVGKGVKPTGAGLRADCLRDAWAVRSHGVISEFSLAHPLAAIVHAREDDGLEEAARTADAILRSLPEDEATVLRLRFGIGDHRPHSQDDIAAKIGTNRHVVRLTEQRAINRLREQMGVAG